jgi:hypothetical protein
VLAQPDPPRRAAHDYLGPWRWQDLGRRGVDAARSGWTTVGDTAALSNSGAPSSAASVWTPPRGRWRPWRTRKITAAQRAEARRLDGRRSSARAAWLGGDLRRRRKAGERRPAQREGTAVQRLTRAATRATTTSGPWRRATASDRPSRNKGEAAASDRGCRGERVR